MHYLLLVIVYIKLIKMVKHKKHLTNSEAKRLKKMMLKEKRNIKRALKKLERYS